MRRQISDDEKRQVLERQGRRCFIDNHSLADDEQVEFDHIEPFSGGGETALSNIGAVCKRHNRDKQTLSLSEYRDRLQMRAFFQGAPKRRLDDLLRQRLGDGAFGRPLGIEHRDETITVTLDGTSTSVPIHSDPATDERYFFATLPIPAIANDVELQPRPLEADRVWELYRHLRTHTQLAPAVCRLVGERLLLFDGQHKAAAQVWAGRRVLDCKVYIEPDVRRLKETNLSAHDKLRQMPFYTSTLLQKYADMASEDWNAFLEIAGPKTEAAFAAFMRARDGLSQAEAVRRIRSMIHQDIIDASDNQLRDYIQEENRGRNNPITLGRLTKTFFAEFVAPPPLNDEFESPSYHRDEERENLVKLFNLVVEHMLADRWAPERKDSEHQKAERLFAAGALRAWVPFLRDAIAADLKLFDQDERRRIFYRELSSEDFETIRTLIGRLTSHKVWQDPDPSFSDLRYDNQERAKEILKSAGLTPGWLVGVE